MGSTKATSSTKAAGRKDHPAGDKKSAAEPDALIEADLPDKDPEPADLAVEEEVNVADVEVLEDEDEEEEETKGFVIGGADDDAPAQQVVTAGRDGGPRQGLPQADRQGRAPQRRAGG